jgi:hypothetical protein
MMNMFEPSCTSLLLGLGLGLAGHCGEARSQGTACTVLPVSFDSPFLLLLLINLFRAYGWRQNFKLRGNIPFNSVNDGFFAFTEKRNGNWCRITPELPLFFIETKRQGVPTTDAYAQVLGEAIAVALARENAGKFTADEKSRDVCP